jgi:hypothetical protein
LLFVLLRSFIPDPARWIIITLFTIVTRRGATKKDVVPFAYGRRVLRLVNELWNHSMVIALSLSIGTSEI